MLFCLYYDFYEYFIVDEKLHTLHVRKIEQGIPLPTAREVLATSSAGNTRRNKTDTVHPDCVHS